MNWEYRLARLSETAISDFNAICQAHDLRLVERNHLAQTIAGALPGNRDKPLFFLAKWVSECLSEKQEVQNGTECLFYLLTEENCQPANTAKERVRAKRNSSLLDFLVSKDDFNDFETISNGIVALAGDPASARGIKAFTELLARSLHAYRVRHLPFEAYRQDFYRISRYYTERRPDAPEPQDRDSFDLWLDQGSRRHWTMHRTVLSALIAFDDRSLHMQAAPVSDAFRTFDHDDAARSEFSETESWRLAPGSSPDQALSTCVVALQASPLKIFKGPQLRAIEELVPLGRHMWLWPQSCLIELSLSPAQRLVVGRLRDKQLVTPIGIKEVVSNTSSFNEVVTRYFEIARIANDCLFLLAQLKNLEPPHRTGPQFSKLESGRAERTIALRRRQSFSKLSEAELQGELLILVEPLELLRNTIMSMLKNAEPYAEPASAKTFLSARTAFEQKLLLLYCEDFEEETNA